MHQLSAQPGPARVERRQPAIDAVEKEGGKIAFVAVLVDRQEGGRQKIEERGYTVYPLFTKEELLGGNAPSPQAGVHLAEAKC